MRIGSIDINHLITFCKIFHDFDSMCKDLLQLYDYYDEEMVITLENVVKGKSSEFHAKLFYNKYKDIIDLIDKESGISNFFFCIYDIDGYFNDNFRLFYRYIKQNIIHLNDILELLLSIRKLEVSKITLDLVNNLKSLRHALYREFNNNSCINYVADIKFISEHNDRIIYESISGDYILKLKILDDNSYKNNREIIVSNLLFDKCSLPQEISEDSIYCEIIEKKDKFDDIHNALNNLTELNEILIVINEMISKLSKVLDRIDRESEKSSFLYEELVNKIIELENIRDEYENKIMSEYSIDRNEIEYQKKLGLNGR